jgi:hypothetical protein
MAQFDDPKEDRFVSGLDHRLEPEVEVRRFEVTFAIRRRVNWPRPPATTPDGPETATDVYVGRRGRHIAPSRH